MNRVKITEYTREDGIKMISTSFTDNRWHIIKTYGPTWFWDNKSKKWIVVTLLDKESMQRLSLPYKTAYKILHSVEKTDEVVATTQEPIIGSLIYVNSHFYIDHGQDDVVGGLATVTNVKEVYHGKTRRLEISVKEHPGSGYYWDILAPEQEKLKKEFGDKFAYESPDYG